MIGGKRIKHLVFLQNLTDSLLWLEVKEEREHPVIVGGGNLRIPKNEETEEKPDPKELFAQSLHEIRAHLHINWLTRCGVIFIAPSHRLSARFLETPPTEMENIRDLVAFEVSEALQVPIEEIAWDMHLSSQHGNTLEKHLLWVAARKEYVDSILADWPKGVLAPTQVTPDFWAVYEFLLNRKSHALQEPCVIVSSEGDRATLTVADPTAIHFTRSVMLTRPQTPGKESWEIPKEQLLATEIERTLLYSADRFPQGSIRKMILGGFENWEKDRILQIAETNGMAVEEVGIRDIAPLFESAETAELAPEHFPMLCIAYCRLVHEIQGLNLLATAEESPSWQSWVPEAALPSTRFLYLVGGLAAFILFVWIVSHVWFNHAVSNRLQRGQELLQLAERLNQEEIGLRELSRIQIPYADLFLFLAENLPNEVLVKSISIDVKTGVDLVLVGGAHPMVLQLLDKMNSSPYFLDVVEDRAVNEKEGFAVYIKGKLKLGG